MSDFRGRGGGGGVANSHSNYDCDVFICGSLINFKIGLVKNEDLQNKAEHMQIYKSENWKKIYINLSQLIIPNIPNSSFQIYFESSMLDNDSEGCLYLDNIKVVY